MPSWKFGGEIVFFANISLTVRFTDRRVIINIIQDEILYKKGMKYFLSKKERFRVIAARRFYFYGNISYFFNFAWRN